jgi:hypothetical protein
MVDAVKQEKTESTPVSTPQVQSTPMAMDTTSSSEPTLMNGPHAQSTVAEYESVGVPSSLHMHQPQPQNHAQHVNPEKLEHSPEQYLMQFDMSSHPPAPSITPAMIPRRSTSLANFHARQNGHSHPHSNSNFTTAPPLSMATMSSNQYPRTTMSMPMSIDEHPPHGLFEANGQSLVPAPLNVTKGMNPMDSYANMF